MVDKAKYEENIQKIVTLMDGKNVFYVPLPKSESLIEILKIRFDEEAAAICAHMSVFPVSEASGEIAKRVQMKQEALIPVLDRLIAKGLVFCSEEDGVYKYCIHSIEPGLIMTSFAKGKDDKETRELAVAFNKYLDIGGLGQVYRASEVPLLRVLPIEEEIQSDQVVLSYEKVSEFIKGVSYTAVAHCQCKISKKLIGETCAHGSETEHCMLFDDFARNFVTAGYAREITKAEAVDIIKRTQELGLVHMSINTKNDYHAICNCCSCCCFMLRSFLHFQDEKGRSAWAPSNFFACVEREICDGCKELAEPVCIGKCPTTAISLKNGKALVNAGKCIGCGICGYSCPIDGAIALKRKAKEREEPAEDLENLIVNVISSH